MKNRRIGTFLAFVALAALSLSGLAWACTATAAPIAIVPSAGPGGTELSVTGHQFLPGIPVEIRWNTADGLLIGNATGPNFAVAVKPPADAAPGFYYVVARQTDSQGQTTRKMVEVFEVTTSEAKGAASATPARVSGELWSGFNASSAKNFGSYTGAVPSGPASPARALGIGLLAAGLVSLSAISILQARRRVRSSENATAESSGSHPSEDD